MWFSFWKSSKQSIFYYKDHITKFNDQLEVAGGGE